MRLVAFLTVFGVIAGHSSVSAASISDTYLFGPTLGTGAVFADNALIQWTHSLTFVPAAQSIQSATLEIRHAGTRNNANQEVWWLSTQGNLFLGTLATGSNSNTAFQTSPLTLSSSLYASLFLPAASWSLALKIQDQVSPNTGGQSIALDYSKLTVDYTPVSTVSTGQTVVPEPASLLLLGTGLAATAARVRRRKSKP